MRRIAVTPALMLLLAAVPGLPAAAQQSAAQPASAGSAAEQTVRELVGVMNSGDPAAVRAFVDQRFAVSGPNGIPAEQRVARLGNVRSRFGELAVRSVDASRGGEATAVVQATRTEQWIRMIVAFDDGTPARILRVGFAPAAAPDAPRQRLSDAEIVEQLRGYVERLASRDVFSGTVLLAKGGKPLYQAAFGEANKDFGVRNTVDTRFNLGSMNKMFTRSEEHTSELQSRQYLVCRLLLEKKK